MSGFYFNPGNAAFCSDARSEIYVDKTLLLNELTVNLFNIKQKTMYK